MTGNPDIPSLALSLEQFTASTAADIEFPVDVGERWPVIRTGTRDPIHRGVRKLIYERDDKRCRFCQKRGYGVRLELDHIIPWSAGGPDRSSNLRTLCHSCNEHRSNYRTSGDSLATPVTFACDECIKGWIRQYGMTRYGQVIPGNPEVPAYCGNHAGIGLVTDPRRLK